MEAAAAVAGIGLQAVGSIYSGIREKQNANLEAKMLEEKGQQELTIAQREALQHRREGKLASSRALAVAASSGGGTGDATVIRNMAGIKTRADANVLTDLYRGQQARSDLYSQAGVRRREGRDAVTSSLFDAGSSIYGGISRINRDKRAADYYNED